MHLKSEQTVCIFSEQNLVYLRKILSQRPQVGHVLAILTERNFLSEILIAELCQTRLLWYDVTIVHTSHPPTDFLGTLYELIVEDFSQAMYSHGLCRKYLPDRGLRYSSLKREEDLNIKSQPTSRLAGVIISTKQVRFDKGSFLISMTLLQDE